MKKIIFIFMIIHCTLIAGRAQWSWIYPNPQGHRLNAVSFANNSTGISAGMSGAFIKTTDGGVSWTYKNLGLSYDFISCYMLNATTGFIGGYYGRIFKTMNSGENWSLTTLSPANNVNNFFFINQNTGYVACNSDKLFKTTDCGMNWSYTTVPDIYSISAIYFINANTGFVAGSGSRNCLLKTTNGGLNWFSVSYLFFNNINNLYCIHFADSLNGYFGGANRIFGRSTDGGNNWFLLPFQDNYANIRSIKFVNSTTGFYISENDTLGKIYKTTSGGSFWKLCVLDSSATLNSISAIENNVIAVGNKGRIINSTNSGRDWVSNSSGIKDIIYPVKFQNENEFIAIDYSYLYSTVRMFRTTNSGMNWINYAISANVSGMYNFYFYDMNTGYAVGKTPSQYGKILKTTNAGANWTEQATIFNTIFAGVEFINPNTGLTCGMLGNIVRTSNGGVNWTVVNAGGPHWHSEVHFLDENTAYSENTNGDVYKSTNGGINWFISANIGKSINTIQFTDQLTGYLGTNGVYKSTNGGYNWFRITDSTFTCPALKFYNSNTGFISVYNGKIFRTTNGGINWINESYVSSSMTVGEFFFITSDIVYAAGTNMLIKTTNGGLVWINNISKDIPKNYLLFQNYPNPFNPSTKIKFDVPSESKNQKVKVELVIYNILGKEITTLVNEQLQPGTYEVTFDGSNLPSGVYFYQLRAGDYSETRKLVLLK